MKKTDKVAVCRSYRLLILLISLMLLLSAALYFGIGALAAEAALLYGTAAALPILMLASSLSQLREHRERPRRVR